MTIYFLSTMLKVLIYPYMFHKFVSYSIHSEMNSLIFLIRELNMLRQAFYCGSFQPIRYTCVANWSFYAIIHLLPLIYPFSIIRSITRIQVTNSTRPPSVISSIIPYLVHKIRYNQHQITLNNAVFTLSPN